LGSLRIPERFRGGVAAVADLSDASFADLLHALREHSVGETAADLVAEIGEHVPSISSSTMEAMIASLASMQGVQRSSHADAEAFANDVWEALADDSPELVEHADEASFKERMEALLKQTSVHLTVVKVAELRREVERSFCGARVLTDIRTAFGDDATKAPAMTVMQTLEIMFHDDMGRHREFYVGLEDNDLLILKEAVDRAIQKKATLVELLGNSDFELFG
jgi:hypothetical protein